MKQVLLIALLMVIAYCINAQTANYDLNEVKAKVAEQQGIAVSTITSIEVLTFGSQTFVKAKFKKDNKPTTLAQEYRLGGPGGILPIGASITCTGVGCSECDIEGLPVLTDVWCNCVRKALEDGYCNMTKSIGSK